MFKKTLTILTCMLALPLLLSSAINLSNTAAESAHPQIVVDNANNIHVAWIEMAGSRGAVYYIMYNGQAWSTPVKISSRTAIDVGESIRQLAIDCDTSNRIYVAWNESSVVRLRIKSGTNWGGETVVASTGLRNDTVRMSVRSQGNLSIIWWNTGGSHTRTQINGSWESVKEVSQGAGRAKHPDVSFGSNRIYAVWVKKSGGIYSTMYSYRGTGYNSTWSSERKVSSDKYDHEFPRVTIPDNNVQHALFLTYHGGPKIANVSRGSGNGFSSRTEVSGLATHHFTFLYHRGNILYAGWQQGGYYSGQGIFYTVNAGNGWSSVERTPDSKGAMAGDIAASTDNKTHYVVWSASGEIWLYTSSGVASPVPIPNKPPRARFTYYPYEGLYPLDVNFDGRASSDSDGKIVSYKWKFGDGTSGSGKTIGHTYTKKGTYEVELKVTDNDGDSGTNNALVKVVGIQPPVGVKYEMLENRSLFFIEYLYKITWNKNPLNLEWGSNVVEYKIYRKKTGDTAYSYFITVKAEDNNEYFDRTLGTTYIQYQYAIKGVDSMGRESDLDVDYYIAPENTTYLQKKTVIIK